MVYLTTNKIPPESTHGKTLFWAQIQDGRHYTGYNIQMALMLELSNIETHMRCHFQLALVWPFVCEVVGGQGHVLSQGQRQIRSK